MRIIFGFITLLPGLLLVFFGFFMVSEGEFSGIFLSLLGAVLAYGGGRILAKEFDIID